MFRHDYSKLFMMKIDMAIPDYEKNISVVWQNCTEVLDTIIAIDTITLWVSKIVYLVGWQYLGHDDKYPAFFEVNKGIKCDENTSPEDSLNWLISEAKKYNTVVSLHINLSDAYMDSPLWDTYIEHDLIVKNMFGKPKVTGRWNKQKAYQVSFLKEYNSGLFQKRIDKLCSIIPLTDIGTVHVDAFFARRGKGVNIKSEKLGRRKMIEYCMSKGIDVTSEFLYREWKCGHRAHFGKSDIVDLIPAYWHTAVSRRDVLSYSARELTGSINSGIAFDKSMNSLIYGNLKGEDIIGDAKSEWHDEFAFKFATYGLPYLYLNELERLYIIGIMHGRRLYHSGNVVSYVKDKKITKNDKILKINNELCLSVPYLNKTYVGYSENGKKNKWYLENGSYDLYAIKGAEKQYLKQLNIVDGTYIVKPEKRTMYVVRGHGMTENFN